MRIQLQRDMMYWDSGGSTPTKPPKKLTIANIDKLIGIVTSSSYIWWECVNAYEHPEDYDMIFNQVGGNTSMQVRILRNGQYSDYGNCNYIVEIRQYLKRPNGTHTYSMSTPAAYGITDSQFGNPKTFSNWLDSKLTQKKLDVDARIWNEKPWYEKLWISIKDFLPKNVNPKSGTKRITAKKAAP